MDAARSDDLRIADLAGWLRGHLVEHGFMLMPDSVHEPTVGTVPLNDGAPPSWTSTRELRAARIVATTRERVTAALRGLLVRPVDDRFLTAAIFAGRVARVTTEHGTAWRPRLQRSDRLSDVVLACFAADALDHRNQYDVELCVCDVCGRISFDERPTLRTRCLHHE
ncbi:Hypothetical protein A7982_02648 [Minicystis rosea]|nr:Hypothetical protein A7982_02648 [Minicystis rosea]